MMDRGRLPRFLAPESLAALVALFVLGLTTYSWMRPIIDPRSANSAIGLASTVLGIVLIVMGVVVVLYRRSWRRAQTRLNDAADQIAKEGTYSLYLRPFVTSGRIKVPNAWPHLGQRVLLGDPWDLELALATVLNDDLPTIAIGDVKSGVGAAKVVTNDADWKQTFQRLAKNARLILAVPLDRPSTLWEMAEIADDLSLRRKTAFIMPPSSRFYDALLFPFRRSIASRWRKAVAELQVRHIDLPRYSHRGGVFVIGDDGRASALADFRSFRPDHVHSMMTSLANETQQDRVRSFNEVYAGFHPHLPRLFRGLSVFGILNPYGFKTLFFALLIALPVRFVALHPFHNPSTSMQPTIQVGDFIAAWKGAYGYNRFSFAPFHSVLPEGMIFARPPSRGDVVIYRLEGEPERDYLKRVIGLPGDRVQILYGVLHVNGEPVQRAAIGTFQVEEFSGQIESVPMWRETLPGGVSYSTLDRSATAELDNTAEFVVPTGHCFVIGDDRDNSFDSRVPEHGTVPLENLIGRVDWVLYSDTQRGRALRTVR